MTRVLAAGDRFIRTSLFRDCLEQTVDRPLDIRELEFDWPDTAFGTVGEVHEASGTEEQLIDALEGAAAVVTQLAPLTERVLEARPELRLIAVSRGGPTNINVDAARRRGVRVANVPGRNGVATAEMTVGLALALMRRIPLAHSSMLQHRWRGDLYRWNAVGGEVSSATIGLLGGGAVGRHVAEIFAAMGAEVLVHDPYLVDGALDGVAERVDTAAELFTRSDLVSVHARLTPETRHLVDRDHLGLMPEGGLLVNAARGGLMDYDAVAEALDAGRLGGVALDVYPEEPADFSHRLFELAAQGANLVLTPHIAGASRETAHRAAAGTAEEVRRFLAGLPARNPLVEGDADLAPDRRLS